MTRGALAEASLWGTALALFVAGFGLPDPRTPPFELVPKSPEVLRVVTWNVGGAGRDGEWGSSLDDEHVEHVAAVLRELDPDLCFLQEVRSGLQTRRLLEALGAGWVRETASSGRGRRVAALAQRGMLEPVDLDVAGGPRDALAVRYSPRAGGAVVAVGLHADVRSAERRNDEIGAIAAVLARRAGTHDEGHLLVGDLNFDLDLDKRRDLFTDDAYLDVETYNFVAGHFRDAGRGTGATAEPDRRLDYVFVEPGAFEVRSAGPVKGRRVGDMDHDPVAADLVRTQDR